MTAGWKGCAMHRPTFPLTAIWLRQLCHAVKGEVSAPAATNERLVAQSRFASRCFLA